MKNLKKCLLILTMFSLASTYAQRDRSMHRQMLDQMLAGKDSYFGDANPSECIAQLDVESFIVGNDPQAKVLFAGLQTSKVELQTFVAYFLMKGRIAIEPILNTFKVANIPVFVLKSKNKIIALITEKVLDALSQYQVTVLEEWSDLSSLIRDEDSSLSKTTLLHIKADTIDISKFKP